MVCEKRHPYLCFTFPVRKCVLVVRIDVACSWYRYLRVGHFELTKYSVIKFY